MEIINLATGLHQSLEVPFGVRLGDGVFDPVTGRVLVITSLGTGQFQVSPPALLPEVLPWAGDSLFLSPDGRFAYICAVPMLVQNCQLRRRSDDAVIATYEDVGPVLFAPDGGHLIRTGMASKPGVLRYFSAADPLQLVWSRAFETPFHVTVGQIHTFVSRFTPGSAVLSRIDPATGLDVVSRNGVGLAKAGGTRVFDMIEGGILPFVRARLRSFDGESLSLLVDRDPALSLTKAFLVGFEVSPDGRRVFVQWYSTDFRGTSLFDGDTLASAGGAGWYGDSRPAVVPPEPWCELSVSPPAVNLPVEGGIADFTVSVTDNCGAWGVRGGFYGYVDSPPVRQGPAVIRFFAGRNTETLDQTYFVGIGPSSFNIVSAAETQAPAAPRIAGIRVTSSLTTIHWTPSPTGPYAGGFVIEGGVLSGPIVQQIDASGDTRSIDLSALPPGTYFAQVRARNKVGLGAASAPVTFTIAPATPPQPPDGLAVEVRGTTVTMSWHAPASGPAPAFYVIEGAVAGGGFAEVGRTSDSRTDFTVGGAPAGIFRCACEPATAPG